MNIRTFTVLPQTPPELQPLMDIAYNMWYAWNWESTQLFYRLDADLWEETNQNPVLFLSMVDSDKLAEAAKDDRFIGDVHAIHERLKNYMKGSSWHNRKYGEKDKTKIAYFCLEYGIHESLPVYSGGLGVLAGDHLKSASDLGIPLVGVGLLYRDGYFRQYLNAEGLQQEYYHENNRFNMPVVLEKKGNGDPLVLDMMVGNEKVFYQIWRVDVGRVPLFLLDTNIPQNTPASREITARLYDSDRDTRIRQEIVLGIGGYRALEVLGVDASAYHINEGHSAFLMIERIRHFMKERNLSFKEAKEIVWASSVFTTHTPVPAGNEAFSPDLVKKYMENPAKEIGMNWDDFMNLGKMKPDNKDEFFCMTILALKLAAHANGVSKLHGVVSRNMWKDLYPGLLEKEVPIGSVTNGIHARSWLSPQLSHLFRWHVGQAFDQSLEDFDLWENVDKIPDEELWKTHAFRKERLIRMARRHLRKCMKRRGASMGETGRVESILDPSALTIGFARRFATYKRGDLFTHNLERLSNLLLDETRPIQFVFAGKAHPADGAGKEIIRRIYDLSQKPEFRRRIVFLEDYDINIARHLVQGVDIWLNNPVRPQEASGTSGMKAAVNGVLNLSIPDGWWDEAYEPQIGWRIGRGESYGDFDEQNRIEANLLYRVLEKDIIPLYYERDEQGVPHAWVARMKACIKKCGAQFNTHRMLVDYTEEYYRCASDRYHSLVASNYAKAKELSAWREKLDSSWGGVEISRIDTPVVEVMYTGDNLNIVAWVKLGELKPEDVQVEVYHGPMGMTGEIDPAYRVPMTADGKDGDATVYKSSVAFRQGGEYGVTVRVLPGHKELACTLLPGRMKWA